MNFWRTRALPEQCTPPVVQEQVAPPVVQEQVARPVVQEQVAPPVVVPEQVDQPNPPPPLVPDVQPVRPDGDRARPVGQIDLGMAAHHPWTYSRPSMRQAGNRCALWRR